MNTSNKKEIEKDVTEDLEKLKKLLNLFSFNFIRKDNYNGVIHLKRDDNIYFQYTEDLTFLFMFFKKELYDIPKKTSISKYPKINYHHGDLLIHFKIIEDIKYIFEILFKNDLRLKKLERLA